MKMRFLLSLLGLGGATGALAITVDFNLGLEGWTSDGNGSNALTWSSTGGNPQGYAILEDLDNGWGYFKAPGSFISTPALYGGTLSFDMRHVGTFPVLYSVRAAIQGAGLTLINESVFPTSTWTNYSFSLVENTGWRKFSNAQQNYSNAAPQATQAEIQAALASMTSLMIAGDYNNETSPGRDITHLDNVRLDTVPEPASMLALGVGIAALTNRRKKRS